MKKIIFTIMIMLLTATGVSAAEPELKVLPACGVVNGQVEVTVTISKNDIVVGGSFVVGYDDTLLSPASITPGASIGTRPVFENLYFDRDGIKGVKLNFMAKYEDDEKIPLDDGVLCTIIFDVLEADKTVSNVYIADAYLCDSDNQYVPSTVIPGKIYLNQFVCDAVFTKDGVETNKLSDSGMALKLDIFNGTKAVENPRAYVAQYSSHGKLISVNSVPYTLSSGNSSSQTFNLDVDKDTQNIKVMFWNEENAPYDGVFYIER